MLELNSVKAWQHSQEATPLYREVKDDYVTNRAREGVQAEMCNWSWWNIFYLLKAKPLHVPEWAGSGLYPQQEVTATTARGCNHTSWMHWHVRLHIYTHFDNSVCMFLSLQVELPESLENTNKPQSLWVVTYSHTHTHTHTHTQLIVCVM